MPAKPASTPPPPDLADHVNAFTKIQRPRLDRFWLYYRNPFTLCAPAANGVRHIRQAQEMGLPARIIGLSGREDGSAPTDDRARQRREAVIENDIAWRVQAMVDFIFGKPVVIKSDAADQAKAKAIEEALEKVWELSGGIALLQEAALLGHIYGHVDFAVTFSDELAKRSTQSRRSAADPADWLNHIRIEAIEPRRGFALMDPGDYRRHHAYVITPPSQAKPEAERTLQEMRDQVTRSQDKPDEIVEVVTGTTWTVYQGSAVLRRQEQHATRGQLPIVHIQNIAQPFEFAGIGEVEPLMPMQDELNTRLSDRASRVTLQSFKMYLAKHISGFEMARVGPGQVWSSDDTDANIQEFGGDGVAPGEDAHIREIREAMDKISAMPPLASGVIQAKIGNLSSANALRITLMGVLAKTARKRVTYGDGIIRVSHLILTALDQTGILATTPAERDLRLVWPDPLPEDSSEILKAAESKQRLGVPTQTLLTELGYGPADPSIN